MTPRDLYNVIFDKDRLVHDSSNYFISEDEKKVVRISDHNFNARNFWLHNEEVEDIFLVYSIKQDELTDEFERKINRDIKEMCEELNVYADYFIYVEGEDVNHVKFMVNRFIK